MTLAGQVDSILKKQLDKIIFYDTDISFENIPAFIIGIVDGDSTYAFTYSDTTKIKVSDSSVYEIGGLTKVFTAQLCQVLAQKNRIDLQAPINQYLPLKYRNPVLSNIKIRNLVSHTSGLLFRPPNLGSGINDPDDPYRAYSKENLLNYLLNIEIRRDTGIYLYSHLNYALPEIVLEQATQQDFESLMGECIFIPENMHHSYVTNTHKKLCPGFDRSGRISPAWSFPSFAASEGIKTTATDLLSYMQKQLRQPSESFKALLIPTQKIKGTKKTYVAQGWHLFKNKKGHNIFLHSGKTNGHAASVHFIPDTQTAVILLTNSPGKMDGLATLVLRMINNNWKRKS